jgi:hypothetical protein
MVRGGAAARGAAGRTMTVRPLSWILPQCAPASSSFVRTCLTVISSGSVVPGAPATTVSAKRWASGPDSSAMSPSRTVWAPASSLTDPLSVISSAATVWASAAAATTATM